MGFIGRWAWLNKSGNRKTRDFGEDLGFSGRFKWPDGFDKMGWGKRK
jgi:hypothetical protein